MGTFDSSSPATNHQALSDIDAIRLNKQGLRDNESSNEASPPSNPVPGQFWHTADTQKIYQRTNAGAWQFLWSVSDLPARASELSAHTGANITASVTVHGIRQGAGNGLDADTVDGNHAADFAAASHVTATSGIHGVGAGLVVGTTLAQTLTNKTLSTGTSITANVSVSNGITIDGRDISVDGAKLDTYPGGGRATPSDNSIVHSMLTPTTGKLIHEYTLDSGTPSSITISGLDGNASENWRVELWLVRGSDLCLRFNGDTGNNYRYLMRRYIVNGGGAADDASQTSSSIYVHTGDNDSNTRSWIEFRIRPQTGLDMRPVQIHGMRYRDGAFLEHITGMGVWQNSANNITSITFFGVGMQGILPGTRVRIYSHG